MYLKSIEMHGFKSFANKIVLDFHNGITGIVGPNGSGKSNVADAVRWVLGEQSAKQLRGASMQDVIFAGTENRKALSYAYVAITLDNADHVLPVAFDEVTVARRVYRSGESEYLLNGTACRLRDVQELFYDTGIGKEGYSIIGQGQIERILSGRPEERRELFDEAVGIVKFKKRKYTAEKKLNEEQENLVRAEDLLQELFNRLEPLEQQSKDARRFLDLKERQKRFDVNLFLLDMEHMEEEKQDLVVDIDVTERQLDGAKTINSHLQTDFDELEEKISEKDEAVSKLQDDEKKASLTKRNLEHEIELLKEQIRFNETSELSQNKRLSEITEEITERKEELAAYEREQKMLTENAARLKDELLKAQKDADESKTEVEQLGTKIENNNKEIFSLMEEKTKASSEEERLKTLEEQCSIRRSRLNQRLLSQKTQSDERLLRLSELEEEHKKATDTLEELKKASNALKEKEEEWKKKRADSEGALRNKESEINRARSRYESTRNIAERYEGYGNAIRRVMEQKDREKGLVGVVADLIHVEKRYETAIETALGGSIQNIVTEDEGTAKRMIAFLKKNHAGRATFLPMTSVDGRNRAKTSSFSNEPGVIGPALDLVEYDLRYEGILSYLVGRVVVAEHIDAALALAKKNHYSLNIVTLEGEYLRPGGSLSGGAFKNAGNLLSRNRQLEELEKEIASLEKEKEVLDKRIDDIDTAMALLEDEKEENAKHASQAILAENTASVSLQQAKSEAQKLSDERESIRDEEDSIEKELLSVRQQKETNEKRRLEIEQRQKELREENESLAKTLTGENRKAQAAMTHRQKIEIEEGTARQKTSFAETNIARIRQEIEKNRTSREQIIEAMNAAKEESHEKSSRILSIRKTMEAAEEEIVSLRKQIQDAIAEKESMDAERKGFFERKSDISDQITNLKNELFRLQTKLSKTEDSISLRTNYMWEEYELTRHAALELKDASLTDAIGMRRMLANIRETIREMGHVNVNAIEEYAQTKERYDVLKAQHDDIVEAKIKLEEIIQELDEGMRKQFEEGFKDIQREFDAVFKKLFGGGKGTLSLMPNEDILETGIVIVAQPPGKKLQNMMQLSGGEKSLTAIALLFAIQNLKPSPFCLLDEIEAALDDSNVGRYANYLHRLTEHTQFIVITHRRGTMNAADRLYGITMQEKGVSTLVSVNLIENELDE